MILHKDADLSPETPGAGPCPRCGAPLTLLVEPAVAEFCCDEGHSFPIVRLLEEQALAARSALEEALRFWETHQEQMTRLVREAQAAGESALESLYLRRLRIIQERLEVLRQAISKSA